jgi:hypothetical protein
MDPLYTFVSDALTRPLDPRVLALAEHIRSQCKNVQAVLVYGSTLRGVAVDDSLVDYYVLTSTHADYALGAVPRFFAKLVPPNVYYAEHTVEGQLLRAKYAVLPIGDLWHRVRSSHTNPYFWVRFCQPMALAFAADDRARQQVCHIVCDAIRTAYGHEAGLAPSGSQLAKWSALFNETYLTELRPERSDRAAGIVETNRDYFETISALVGDVAPSTVNWATERRRGKMLTLLRLAKAAFTFTSGPEYIAWKIERHSGTKITLSPWQKRHPLLAGLLMLPKLLKRGVVR